MPPPAPAACGDNARRPMMNACFSRQAGGLLAFLPAILPALWLALAAGTAASQPLSPPDAAGMERRVAACTACHGRGGQAGHSAYFPRIAGKPAGYLYEQLRSFRDGRRQQAEMRHLLAHLSDAYLREMADYFATMQLPYAPPAPSDLPPQALARGRALVFEGDAARGITACADCHGAALTGVEPGIPGLLGLPRLYLAAQLGAWRTGERRALAPDCMAEVGRRLEPGDITAVAGWLAAQPVPAQADAAAAPPRPLPQPCSAQDAAGAPAQ